MDRNVSSKDINLLKKENNEFPILCETCLGPNNMVRMIKNRLGKTCKVCENAFVSFRWKPGPRARYKNTIICQKCARFKNLCQTCLFDLKYNLPVQVRDKFMNDVQNKLELPDNNMNLLYKLNNNFDESIYNDKLEGNKNLENYLSNLNKILPYYRRNRPKICTFWLRNLCNRGSECPYLHENLNDTTTSDDNNLTRLEERNIDKNIKNRYKGVNDKLAINILNRLESNSNDSNSNNLLNNDNLNNNNDENNKVMYPSMNPNEAIKRLE